MTWYKAAEFAAEDDLHSLHQFLSAHGICHRLTEVQGRQVLLLPQSSSPIDIAALLAQWRQADTQGNIHHTLPVAVRPWSVFWLRARRTPLTLIIILLGLYGFAAFALSLRPLVNALAFANFPYLLTTAEVWRLVSPAFLHFFWWHWLFNALMIWHLGSRLEQFLGAWRYTLLFLWSAVVANLAQYLASGDGYFGGLSGVVYAFCACVFVLHRLRPNPVLAVGEGLFIFMLVWLLLGFTGAIDWLLGSRVANWAHLGGFVAGLGAAAFIHWRQPAPDPHRHGD